MTENTLELSVAEKLAIRTLRSLAKRWPKTLWIFATGDFNVMRVGPRGERVMTGSGGVDPDYCVTSVEIPNDGGGW